MVRNLLSKISGVSKSCSSSSPLIHKFLLQSQNIHLVPITKINSSTCPLSFFFCRKFSQFATGFAPLQKKPLDSIIDMERAKTRSPEDLITVWDDYHLGRGHIGMSMQAKLYYLLQQRSLSCRHFVVPLWKGSGYTNMFIQVQMPHMIFTGLEDYKARGTQANPHFAATYYTEFAESKGIVLIRGDIVFTGKLSDAEAEWLLETAQSFYLNDTRYKLVKRFNKQTHEFDFKDVLQALEMPNI